MIIVLTHSQGYITHVSWFKGFNFRATQSTDKLCVCFTVLTDSARYREIIGCTSPRLPFVYLISSNLYSSDYSVNRRKKK